MFDTAPATVVHTLNRALLRSNTNRFTTAVFLRLVTGTRDVTISLATGGHPPALIQRQDGSFEETTAMGPLLGVTEVAAQDLDVADYRLGPGDTLVLYTDGLTEARRSGVLFGIEGVKETLSRLRGAPPTTLANALVDAALEHAAGPLSDDVAIVIARVLES
jgi:sigma-B regulation protein RsbU (phosphoserine phosphatase)